MENKTDYEKVKAEVWKEYHKHVVCGTDSHKYWFDRIFDKAYCMGKEHATDHIPDAAKKVDRAMIAAMAMQGLLSNLVWVNAKSDYVMRVCGEDVDKGAEMLKREIAEDSAEFADALIVELGRGNKR